MIERRAGGQKWQIQFFGAVLILAMVGYVAYAVREAILYKKAKKASLVPEGYKGSLTTLYYACFSDERRGSVEKVTVPTTWKVHEVYRRIANIRWRVPESLASIGDHEAFLYGSRKQCGDPIGRSKKIRLIACDDWDSASSDHWKQGSLRNKRGERVVEVLVVNAPKRETARVFIHAGKTTVAEVLDRAEMDQDGEVILNGWAASMDHVVNPCVSQFKGKDDWNQRKAYIIVE